MKKTSVYLTEREVERLARLAKQEGRPQARIVRDAIASYTPKRSSDRSFALARSGEGPGGSVADVPEEELLKGFGS